MSLDLKIKRKNKVLFKFYVFDVKDLLRGFRIDIFNHLKLTQKAIKMFNL